jgi:hypothetical protein
MWIRIDSIPIWIRHFSSIRIRIQLRIRIRIQAKTEHSRTIFSQTFSKSKFEVKNIIHQNFSKVCIASLYLSGVKIKTKLTKKYRTFST